MATLISTVILTLSCGYLLADVIPPPFETRFLMCDETMNVTYAYMLSGDIWENTLCGEDTSSLECHVRLRVQPYHRIIVSLQYAGDSVSLISCQNNYSIFIQQTNLPHTTSSSKGKESCTSISTEHDLISTAEEVLIHFYQNCTEIYKGFRLLLISFHKGICSKDEHRCNNGRCIEYNLRCKDNYNGCGNGECRIYMDTPTPSLIYIVVLITLSGALMTVVNVKFWCWWKKLRRQSRRQSLSISVEEHGSSAPQVEDSSSPDQPPLVSVIRAPAYTPPCAPPPYSIVPVSDSKTPDNRHILPGEPVNEGNVALVGLHEDRPPPYEQ